MAQLKKEGKNVPEDPKELVKWARQHPEVMRRLKKVIPSGSGPAANIRHAMSKP